jgi:hypothetical protein
LSISEEKKITAGIRRRDKIKIWTRISVALKMEMERITPAQQMILL